MSAGDRPALLLALDEAWLRPRCEAFKRAHRGTQFAHLGAMAQAWVPRRNGSRTITRASMGDVLEALEEIYGPSPQPGLRVNSGCQVPATIIYAGIDVERY